MTNKMTPREIAATIIVVLCLVTTVYFIFRNSSPPMMYQIQESGATRSLSDNQETQSAATPSESEPAPTEIVVDVAGQVANPGVYHLPLNSRVEDAIKAAGGLLETGDTEALNMAAKLIDGKQLYIPSKQEMQVEPPKTAELKSSSKTRSHKSSGRSAVLTKIDNAYKPDRLISKSSSSDSSNKKAGGSGKFKNPGDGAVNINTASESELQRLPGVGPSTAKKIIEFRKVIGKFKTVNDLLEVKGIGVKKLEQMKPFIKL